MSPALMLTVFFAAAMMTLELCSSQTLSADGANVCTRRMSFTIPVQVSHREAFQQRYYTQCGAFGWARCTKTRTAYRTAYHNELAIQYRELHTCCPGFTQAGTSCEPITCEIPKVPNGEVNISAPLQAGETLIVKCQPGFELIGEPRMCLSTGMLSKSAQTCENVDECATQDFICHHQAVCNDTDGSYECICTAGFTGDGKTCFATEPASQQQVFDLNEKVDQLTESVIIPLVEENAELKEEVSVLRSVVQRYASCNGSYLQDSKYVRAWYDRNVAPYDVPRMVAYNKKLNNTHLRILYSSNVRTTGEGATRLHVEFNGRECTMPNTIEAYTSNGGNVAFDVHTLLRGSCSATSAGPLRSGAHVITVHIGANMNDESVSESVSFLEIEEVCN